MSLSEFELIRRYFDTPDLAFSRRHVELGIGDDAAMVSVAEGKCLTLTMDLLVESVHFPARAPARFVAHRALAANLSDLAAMGSEPLCFTLGLILPAADEEWLGDFATGLAGLAGRFDCPLVGGDVTHGPLSVVIQAHGIADRDALIRRSGARPGDRVLVTGSLGDAALALPLLVADSVAETAETGTGGNVDAHARALLAAYYQPEPRVAFAQEAAGLVSAGIDISDGLIGDLGHIIAASGVGARIDVDRLPYSAAAKATAQLDARRRAALSGGDDYELCLTAPESALPALQEKAAALGLALTCIGEVVTGSAIALVDSDGEAVTFSGTAYQHFREGSV